MTTAASLSFALSGAAGRMGTAILQVSRETQMLQPALLVDRQFAVDSPPQATSPRCCSKWDGTFADFAVMIDFSSMSGVLSHLSHCVRLQKPMVIGATGFDDAALAQIRVAAAQIPILQSANMSLGVNLCLKLAALARAALPADFEAEIFEIHHKHKRDAPSGTAIALANAIADAWHQRHPAESPLSQQLRVANNNQARSAHSIGHGVLRGGDVVGEHTAFFFGDGERLEITHRATDRKIFARGALTAAHWLVNQPPGLYSMANVLGF